MINPERVVALEKRIAYLEKRFERLAQVLLIADPKLFLDIDFKRIFANEFAKRN